MANFRFKKNIFWFFRSYTQKYLKNLQSELDKRMSDVFYPRS